MEPIHESQSPRRSQASPSPLVELIIHNGRQKGTRRPLTLPVTLIGRSAECDVRLNVEAVSPLHCCLVYGVNGLVVRDLQSQGGTRVNGQASSGCPLNDGDLLTVGPFEFQVRVSGASPAQQLADVHSRHGREKDALRIQAAAVAAQQAGLAEEEGKLQQRRAALEQQEDQLATHLEEKRRRLLELRDQAREAFATVKEQKAAQEAKAEETRRELEAARQELAGAQKQADGQRQRLVELQKRLKQRWHRHWTAERAAMRRHEEEVARKHRDLEGAKEKLQQEREAMHQARLRFNGDAELGRRQLQAAWDQFHRNQLADEERREREKAELRARGRALDERDAALTQADQELEDQKRHWQLSRLALEKEVEGLENRIRNYRRKVFDLEKEAAALDSQVAGTALAMKSPESHGAVTSEDSVNTLACDVLSGREPAPAEAAKSPEPAVPTRMLEPAKAPPPAPAVDDSAIQERVAHLEKLSGELADQRLHLVEQCQRLVQSQQRWQQDRDLAATDLEELGKRLHARELALQHRENALEAAERYQAQLVLQAREMHRQLQGWQSRMTARETAWEGERDCLLAEAAGRQKLAEQRLAAVDQLHQKWTRRRRKELEWLQGERVSCAKLRKECLSLREDVLRRGAVLERDQRALAERALAMEQYQQECIGKSDQPAAAAKRLERLRNRWARLSAAAQKAVAKERESLQEEAAELEEFHSRLRKQAARLAAQEAELAGQQSVWEQAQLMAQDERNRLQGQLESSQTHSERHEKQAAELREEVERLARLLLDDSEPAILVAGKAA